MSDTEEIVIKKVPRAKNTKPEIAREKLKEKRERLKKEKEESLIEEAKKRLADESTKNAEIQKKQIEEEEQKKKSDPNYLILQQISMLTEKLSKMDQKPVINAPPPPPEKPKRGRKPKVVEPEPEPIPVKKVKEVKPRKQRKKVVYLDNTRPMESESNQFIGTDIYPDYDEPAPQPTSQSNLVNYLQRRRNLNTLLN
jgi:hypothetical protein